MMAKKRQKPKRPKKAKRAVPVGEKEMKKAVAPPPSRPLLFGGFFGNKTDAE
jgi:hypothetical protein